MEDIVSFLISEVYVYHLNIAFEKLIRDSAVSLVRMLPSPVTCTLFCLNDGSVFLDLTVDQSYITVVGLGLLVNKRENSLCTGTCHYDSIDLHRELVNVTRELS